MEFGQPGKETETNHATTQIAQPLAPETQKQGAPPNMLSVKRFLHPTTCLEDAIPLLQQMQLRL